MTMTRNLNPNRILGLDPGSRFTGWSLIEDGVPVYWGTWDSRAYRGKRGTLLQRVREVTRRILDDFRPGIVVLEAPVNTTSRHMRLLTLVIEEILRQVDEFGARRVMISPSTARAAIVGDGSATKERVAQTLACRYP